MTPSNFYFLYIALKFLLMIPILAYNIPQENQHSSDIFYLKPSQDTIFQKDQYTNETFAWIKTSLPNKMNTPDGVLYKRFNDGQIRKKVFKDNADIRWWGAKGDGKTNDANAFNNAIQTCSSLGIKLFIKKTAKFYLIVPQILSGDESSNMVNNIHIGIEMKSNMDIISDKAILKMADNISSRKMPTQMRMFFSNNFLENIRFNGLIIDMNGMNNLISKDAPQKYTNITQAHIGFSGTKNKMAAGANNVIIENCEFINGAGASCISTAQSNSEGVNLGNNWIIRNNIFNNNGLDSDDHSSIYAWVNTVECYGNIFKNPKMADGTGGLVAYEVHGSNHSFYNNTIENYYQGLWVGINLSQKLIENTRIFKNKFKVSGQFVDFYNGNLEKDSFYPIDIVNTTIENNSGYITDDFVKDEVKQFIRISAKISPTKVYINNNTVHSLETKKISTFFSGFTMPNQQKSLDEIYITNNTSTGFSTGIMIYFNDKKNMGKIVVKGNNFGKYRQISGLENVDIKVYGSSDGSVKEMETDMKNIITDKVNRIMQVKK